MPFHNEYEETLDPAGIAALQEKKLRAMLAELIAHNRFWKNKLSGIDASRARLSDLPLLTRDELIEDQKAAPPYGTNLTYPLAAYCRLHQTSGTTSGVPLRCPDRSEDWSWWKKCWSAIYHAAGVTPEDRLIFPFSFGPFIGFWAAFETAVEMGNLSLPAGGMSTSARLRFMLDNHVTVVCCTPTYALHLTEVAQQEKIDTAQAGVRVFIVAGEPGGSITGVRNAIEQAFEARVFDHTGMTEVGAYGFECVEAPGGVHINETEFIAEVIDPANVKLLYSGLGDERTLSPGGIEGELVLTNLGRWGFPAIRYRTGDQVRLSRGKCRCGRWFARLEGGILGRTDDMLVIRGNNVYPTAIEAILREFSQVAEFRLEITRQDGLADLRVEIEHSHDAATDGLAERVTQAIRDRLNFRPVVALVPPGSLPRFDMKARRIIRRP